MKAELLPLSEIIMRFPSDSVISLSGAGGKTTLMFRISRSFDCPSVVTTTTKVGADQILSSDIQTTCAEFPPESSGKVIWVSPSLEPHNGKISGCSPDEFSSLAACCRECRIRCKRSILESGP